MTTLSRLPQALLVCGTVRLPEGIALSRAQLRVRLLDVSLRDAPPTVLVEQIIALFNDQAGTEVEFALRGEVPSSTGRYKVFAHVKMNPDPSRGELYKEVEAGDFFTPQAYPVRWSADAPATATVSLVRYAGPAEASDACQSANS